MENYTCESLYVTMSSIADGVISTNQENRIVFINRAAQKLTGWNEHEAIGQPLDIVFNIVNAKTREKIDSPFAQVLFSGVQGGLSGYSALSLKVVRRGTYLLTSLLFIVPINYIYLQGVRLCRFCCLLPFFCHNSVERFMAAILQRS